jgi:hypothetical protein
LFGGGSVVSHRKEINIRIKIKCIVCFILLPIGFYFVGNLIKLCETGSVIVRAEQMGVGYER